MSDKAMTEAGEEAMAEYRLAALMRVGPDQARPVEVRPGDLLEMIAEIRRQRAENAEVRASYERVEKHAQSLAEENAGMNSKLNRLADKGLCQGCEPVCRNCSQDECDLAKERTPLP